jgi:predicted ATPase
MLYVTRLELQNLRRFDSLKIDFSEGGSSALLVGDNGDGKSTVLRSLAMGLCDQSSAAALFRELSGEFVKHGSKGKSFVAVELANRSKHRYRIKTEFIDVNGVFERIEQTHYKATGLGKFQRIDEDAFPWSDIFVSAYGPGIRTFGNADYSYYQAVDAVYSLFKYDSTLQSPELAIRRIIDEAHRHSAGRARETSKKLRGALAKLLHLDTGGGIDLYRRGVRVKGEWGEEDLDSLGDGYRATMTWTLDLMSWWLLNDDQASTHAFNPKNLAGIVIVDELEQHLHPRWQRAILPDVRELFPRIQFIVATHSPLIASSCEDVAVHRLQYGKHDVFSPFGWRAEDVYDMMGLPTSRAEPFAEQLARFEHLDTKRLNKRLSKKDRTELTEIEHDIKALPGSDPIGLTVRLKNLTKQLSEGKRS